MKKTKVQHNSKSINNPILATQTLAEQATSCHHRKLATRSNKHGTKTPISRKGTPSAAAQEE